MSTSRRQSFTANEKLKITATAEEIGNRAAVRKYNVDESCIHDWGTKRTSLETANKDRRASRGLKTGPCPELEMQLVKFTENQKSRGHARSTTMVQMEALNLVGR
ncbi:hypothetical protein HPB50_006765 [Hyalomma asiaticum]|uniref:Uncharacterized protein n=1 Tax=Hyalomma asiaticum TaxID=266040 RepID=A0ACB7SKZ8_HYAAI|nr:hypothetical protein HPB50_006765 [Hyalomma asiaticum]